MPGDLLVVGECLADGTLARITTEVATLARAVAARQHRAAIGVVIAADPGPAAAELARYVPRVLAVSEPALADHVAASVIAERVAALVLTTGATDVLLGATPDGRDVAGVLQALTGWGMLANATSVDDGPDGLTTEASVLGGSLMTRSAFTAGHGIVTVAPNVVVGEAAGSAGSVESAAADAPLRLPAVALTGRLAEEAARLSIEEASVVVTGGRGVGGPDGFALVSELAEALGGAVGATRAAVDSGWIGYGQQIGQTGKTVRPRLYLALGVSGAIQHKVGMQTAETIVAVNRDPDAPLAEFADLYVVGDLFEVVPALLAELRVRAG
jgi:electron transfer flavoprotein alpha subunit